MEGAGASLRFGLAGFVVGASTGWATDRVYGFIAPHLQSSTPRSTMTQSALTAVVGGALVSVMMYAGDRVLESVMDMAGDPLFRMTYYQSALLGSSTARMTISNIQGVLSSVVPSGSSGSLMKNSPMPVSKQTPMQEPGPVMQPPAQAPQMQRKAIPSCAAGSSCGSIML